MPQFELNSNNSKILASGTLNKQWHAQWQINIKDLQHFLPNSSGQFESTGTITGERKTPLIQAMVNAHQIHYQNYQLNNLQSHFIIDPNLQKPSQIEMQASGIQFKKYMLDKFNLTSESTLNQQKIQLHLQKSDKQLWLTLQGQLQNKVWLGQLKQLQVKSNQGGNWQLSKSGNIKITSDSAHLSNITILSTRGNITVGGDWQKQKSWSATATADNFALQNLQFLFPDAIQLQGQLKLTATASQNNNQGTTAQAQLNLNNGTIQYPYSQQQQTLHFQNGQANVDINPKGVVTSWQFNITPQQGLSGDINLPNYQIGNPLLTQMITGKIHVNPIPLQLLQQFIPDTRNMSGIINIDSTIQGTIAKPVIIGELVLNNGKVTIPSLNITLNNIQINAKGQPNSTIQYNASVNSGGGQLKITGNTDLQKPGMLSVLQIQGNQFLAINTQPYQIYASPQLSTQIQNRDIHLTGRIFIPQATLAPPDYKSQSVVLPDDVVFVNQKQQNNTPSFWNLYSQIELDLGDKINVNVSGLQGQLLGNLQLNDVPQRPTTANGILSVKNATYEAYGKQLDVNSGRLIFTGGPLTNPGVAIQASRQVTTTITSNIMSTGISNLPSTGNSTLSSLTAPFFTQENSTRVGINVQGTLKDPQITLFSEPATLSQADILSYLLLNQPASQVSTANAQLLMQAASSLNLGGGQLQQVSNELQKTFGLTQLSVGTSTYYNHQTASMLQNTSLMLGKKITPNLYINYSVGLTAPINILQISYLLSSHWTLQSSTSSLANGIDLLYSFEHD